MSIKKKQLFTRLFCALIVITILFFVALREPLLFRKSYITRITGVELPEAAKIVVYRFGINFYGVEPFLAKIKIDRATYESINEKTAFDPGFLSFALELAQKHLFYRYLDFTDVVAINANETLISRCFLGIACSTRAVVVFTVKTELENFYLYVIY